MTCDGVYAEQGGANKLLGMAIKYAGLRGKEVRVIGRNRSSFAQEERVQ